MTSLALFRRPGIDASLWSLALDVDGLVHLRRHDGALTPTALPVCFSGRTVSAPAHGRTHPTCVYCVLVQVKHVTR